MSVASVLLITLLLAVAPQGASGQVVAPADAPPTPAATDDAADDVAAAAADDNGDAAEAAAADVAAATDATDDPAAAAAAAANAAAIERLGIKVSAPERVQLGEWFEVLVAGSFGSRASLRLEPEHPDAITRNIRLRETITGAELRLPIALARAGELVLESLLLTEGDLALRLPPVTIEVVLDLPPERTPRVAEPLGPLSLRMPRPPVWVFAASMVIALVLLGLWVVGAGRERFEEVYLPPADQVALAALERLRLDSPRTSDEVALLVMAVSDVLRTYIEGRFAVQAPARTTEEFLAEALAEPALAERSETLERFLTLCDLVKYARVRPAPGEAVALVDTAATFVEQTR